MSSRIIDICIHGYTSDGRGVGRTPEGEVVFVPGAIRGETVRTQIVHQGKTCLFGEIKEILVSSPHRVSPPCSVFPDCGGCAILHMDAEEQKYFKKQKVADAFARIGGIDAQIEDTLSFSPYHYRNKAQIPVAQGKDGIACGFYRQGTHEIAPCRDCLLGESFIGTVIDALMAFMKKYNIAPYNEATDKGIVRHLYVRTGQASKEVMISLVTRHPLPQPQAWVDMLLSLDLGEYKIASIMENRNEKKGNTVLGNKNITLYEKDHIFDTLLGVSYKISHHSFYQVNPEACAALYEKAIELAGLTGKEEVFDLYCGIGTISLSLAKKAKRVTGVEIVGAAVRDAKENAMRNQIKNARFIEGKAEEVIPRLYEEGEKADVVIVDPPRKGCDETLLKTIADMKPARLVYVSCDVATMARDVKKLAELGFCLASPVTPVDQFPGTYHVETVALLQQKNLSDIK